MSNSRSRIPSPARSMPMTPRRRETPRKARSVCSPARSTASGRLSCIIREHREQIGSLSLSPMSRKSVLTDNTDIEELGRKSWWRDLDDPSRDVMEVLKDDDAEPYNIFENIDVLSQEEEHHTLDLPESSNSESIQSIIVPQKKLFREKENQPQKVFNPFGTRDILDKLHKENAATNDKTVSTTSKKLFRTESRPVIPAALPETFSNTSSDKTMNVIPEKKRRVHNFFNKQQNHNLNHQNTLHKNMFAKFIESDSEDEIPEIKPKFFALQKQTDSRRPSIRRKSSYGVDNSMASSIDIDDWQLLPSSTMVDFQLNTSTVTGQAPKRTKLSKLSEVEKQMKDPEIQNQIQDDQNKSKEIQIESQIEHNERQRLQDKGQEINSKLVEKSNISEPENNKSKRTQDKSQEICNKPVEKDNINEAENNKSQSAQYNSQEIRNETVEKDNINENNKIQQLQDRIQEITEKEYINKTENNESQRVQDKCQEKRNETVKKDNINEAENSKSQRVHDQSHEIHGKSVEKDNKNGAKNNGCQEEIKVHVKQCKTFEKTEHEEENNISHDGIENNVNKSQEEMEQNENEEENNEIQDEIEDGVHESQEEIEQIESEREEENNEIQDDVDDVNASQEEIEQNESESEEEKNEIQDKTDHNVNESQEKIEQNKSESKKEKNEIQDEIKDDVNESQVEIQQNESESEEENNEIQDDVDDVNASQEEIEQNESESEEENNKIQAEIEDDVNVCQEEIEQNESESEEENNKIQAEFENDVNRSQDEIEQNESESKEENNKIQHEIEDDVNESQEEIEQNESESEEENNETQEQTEDENESQEEMEQNESGVDQKMDYEEENECLEVGRYQNGNQENNSDQAINAKSDSVIEKKSFRKTNNINRHRSMSFFDGSNNSSDAGSGWDSHRTTRKTLRQTFGKDFSIRKSLRAMVIAKTAKDRMTAANDATIAEPQANSTEFPEPEMTVDDEMQAPLEVSIRTKQAIIVERLEADKRKWIEEDAKLEEQIKKRLEQNRPRVEDPFKIPTRPVYRRPLPKPKPKAKNNVQPQALMALQNLPKEFIEDMNYKPPKRFAPRNAAWLTKRLYKYLETKLEPKYNYKARVRAEKFAQDLYDFVQQLRKRNAPAVAPQHAVEGLKHEMARLNIVHTHIEFYNFFNEFLPVEVRMKVIPDIVNKIPHPRSGIFSNIL